MKKQTKAASKAKRGASTARRKLVEKGEELEKAESVAFERLEVLAKDAVADAAAKAELLAQVEAKEEAITQLKMQAEALMGSLHNMAASLQAHQEASAADRAAIIANEEALWAARSQLKAALQENEQMRARMEAVVGWEDRLEEQRLESMRARAAVEAKAAEVESARAESELLMGKMEELKSRLAAHMGEQLLGVGNSFAEENLEQEFKCDKVLQKPRRLIDEEYSAHSAEDASTEEQLREAATDAMNARAEARRLATAVEDGLHERKIMQVGAAAAISVTCARPKILHMLHP